MPGRIFVCHASPDAGAAQRVAAALERAGIECWIAPRDIAPGENYTQAILDALAAAPAVVLVFSETTNESPHVQRELETAVGSGTRIIPVRLQTVEPSPALRYFIGTSQWLEVSGVDQAAWEPLLVGAARRALGKAPQPPQPPQPLQPPQPTQPTQPTPAAPGASGPRPSRTPVVVLLTALVVIGLVVAVALVVNLAGDDGTDDASGGPSSSGPTAASTTPTPSTPTTPAPSTPASSAPPTSAGPVASPVTGSVVVEERFEGTTSFPLGSFESHTGTMVSSLLPGALRVSVNGISRGWDSWVSVDTQPLREWTVRATFVSARRNGECGVMASDGSTVVTADLSRAAGSARISIYRDGATLAQQSFSAVSVTGPLSISLEAGLLVMRSGDVVVASLPPVQLAPITQGGVVGVGDTNDCDFDDFAVLSRP